MSVLTTAAAWGRDGQGSGRVMPWRGGAAPGEDTLA